MLASFFFSKGKVCNVAIGLPGRPKRLGWVTILHDSGFIRVLAPLLETTGMDAGANV